MEFTKIEWLKNDMIKELSNLEITAMNVLLANMYNELQGEIYTYNTVDTWYSDKRLWVDICIPVEYHEDDNIEVVHALFMVNNEDILVMTTDDNDNTNYYRLEDKNDYLF